MAKSPKPLPYQAGDLLVPLTVPIEAQTTIRVWSMSGLAFFENGPNGLHRLKTAPASSDVFVRPADGAPERQQIMTGENLIAAALGEASGTSLTVAEIEKLLCGKGFDKALIEGLTRMLVGLGALKAEKGPRGAVRLTLSRAMRERERRRGYSASFANDLASQSEQLGRLIGHGPTVGAAREELLRALLERHVPKRYHVATGFVDGFKPQFDILVYDQLEFAPLLRAGNLVVVPPEAVRAILEVKSTLNATTLKEALDHLDVVTFMSGGGPPIFRGVFAYDGFGPKPIAKGIRAHHRPISSTTAMDDLDVDPVTSIDQMVTAVCVLGKAIVQTEFARMPHDAEFPWTPATVTVASEAGRDFQAGVFFDLLDRFLRHPYQGHFQRSTLMDAVRHEMSSVELVPLYNDEEWAMPLIAEDGGEGMIARIEAYRGWLNGQAWPAETPSL